MGNYIGGDVTELVCNHPELGSFRFDVKANESATSDKGGIRNADDASMVTGNGKLIQQKNAVRWSLEVPVVADLATSYEEDSLNALAKHPLPGDWIVSHIGGMIRKGTGHPVGDIQADTNNAQIKLKLSGGGVLERIN